MNRFEKQVYECMHPTEKLLEKTTNPLHRAILLNFWRHVHLEGAGEYHKILAPDMEVDHPVYRVSWGTNPGVIEGKAGVLAFYNSVGEAVLWHSDDRLAVADWGVCDEITFHQLAEGTILKQLGYAVEHADRLYHVSSRQAFIWPYDAKARLAGEHLYEDKTSLKIEEVDRREAITPARVREIHREQLGKLEARLGPNFWGTALMRAAAQFLIGVSCSLLVQVAASAAPHPASDNWIGTWGYVSLPPPPGTPIPVAAPPAPPTAMPLGGFTPRPPSPPPPPAGLPAPIDNPGNVPIDYTTLDLGNVTVRQVVRLSQGGSRLRLRFSNENNVDAVPVGAVHVGAAGPDGSIVAGSDHIVTFDGQPSVILPGGAPVLSDSVDLPTQALEKLYISSYIPGSVPTRSPRTLFEYVAGKPGDFTAAATLPGARLMRIPAYVTLVEVQSSTPTGVVVALGDSITQGSASTSNAFHGWPDRLAERLATLHWAVVNAGIGGNRLLRYGLGPSALARLDRDVLSVPGLKTIILMEGINDIGVGLGNANSADPVTLEGLEAADRQIIARAHEHGVRIIGATLTPYQGAFYSSPAGEMVREALNHWILSSGAFDAAIDFAPAVADPDNPLTFDKRYNDTDHLHPNDAGYKAMGDAIDLSLIIKK